MSRSNFSIWHFPPIFVLWKVTCLVTLFDLNFFIQKLAKMLNETFWTIFKHCGFYEYFGEIGYFWSGVKSWSVRVNENSVLEQYTCTLRCCFLFEQKILLRTTEQLAYLRVNSRLDYYFSKWLSILAKNLSWNIFLVRICSGGN